MTGLARLSPEELVRVSERPDADTLGQAARIVAAVADEGEPALLRLRAEHDGIAADAPLVVRCEGMAVEVEPEVVALLERTRDRIASFARAQRECLLPLDVAIEGGRAGHRVLPIARVGCYAPGGRYPLPSSVLMTVVTARVAGVREVWLATPKPSPLMLAAAKIAGADAVVVAGGAQAIAALAYGTASIPAVDLIAGPGNRWVTAAKQLVVGRVGIDMLAGPSELVVIADEESDPERVALALLAQAEHDVDARVTLLASSEVVADAVDAALASALVDLPTREVAAASIARGHACVADRDTIIRLANRLAPEHLELAVAAPESWIESLTAYGALFVHGTEAHGDYGAGPNHVLPTGGTARFQSGLSVLTFLRTPSWLSLSEPATVSRDAAALARLEGLEAHARSAESWT